MIGSSLRYLRNSALRWVQPLVRSESLMLLCAVSRGDSMQYGRGRRALALACVAAAAVMFISFSLFADPPIIAEWPRANNEPDPKQEAILRWYFQECIEISFDVEGQQKTYLNGYQLPAEVSFRTTLHYPDIPDGDANPMRFVLVMPAVVSVSEIDIPVTRPFYIATSEFSMLNAAGLREPVTVPHNVSKDVTPSGVVYFNGTFNQTYAAFVEHLKAEEFGSAELDDDLQRVFANYFENGQNPYLVRDMGTVRNIGCMLSAQWRTQVRLPSIGEWFAAMRGGKNQKYWWGDNWNPPDCWFPPKTLQDATVIWRKIRTVDSGVSNPLGLRHVIGNVSELTSPTEEERRIIYNDLMAQFSAEDLERDIETLPIPALERRAGVSILPDALIPFGASVSNLEFRSEDDAANLLHNILRRQYFGKLDFVTAIGVRWVVEVPEGEVTFDNHHLP